MKFEELPVLKRVKIDGEDLREFSLTDVSTNRNPAEMGSCLDYEILDLSGQPGAAVRSDLRDVEILLSWRRGEITWNDVLDLLS